MVDAALGEILTTCSKMEWLIAHGEEALRPEKRRRNTMLAYKTSEVHYEPLGTVAGIVSWNYREFKSIFEKLLFITSIFYSLA